MDGYCSGLVTVTYLPYFYILYCVVVTIFVPAAFGSSVGLLERVLYSTLCVLVDR